MSLHGIVWSGSLFAAFRPFRCGSKKKCITVEQFVEFLNRHQRDPRLNEILYPYANPDRARDLFHQYEPSKANSQKGLSVSVWSTQDWFVHCQSACWKGLMSAEGFLRFLLSEDNPIVSADKFDLSHDMEQPMCHNFINSSHNTYLTGDWSRL